MKALVKWFNGAPKVLKLILALPFLDIVWVIYRLCKSIASKNTLGTVLAVILLIFGIPWLWLVDLITIAFSNKVLWFK